MTKDERLFLQGLSPNELLNLQHEMLLAEDECYVDGWGYMSTYEFREWYSNEMFLKLARRKVRC